MHPLIEERRPELEDLCRRFHVMRLELFGSFAKGTDQEKSDVDFLVEFADNLPPGEYANSFFGLLEALEHLFSRHVDLVVTKAIDNPYFKESVDQSRVLLYAA